MRLKRTVGSSAAIPTSSTADIAFLLLIFFLATTIFKMENGLPVNLPRAEMGQKVPKQKTAHVYLDAGGNISIDDFLIQMEMIEPIIAKKLSENSTLIVGLTIDEAVPYNLADDVMGQLKRANALNTSFTIEPADKG